MASRSRKPNAGSAKTIAKSGLSLAESLPDEMVSEILSSALTVPDEVFSDNGSNLSPFATFKEPSSAFLLVCKAWFRVGTPLLYKVVVLRSTAQAKALSQTLSNNTALGQFVTKLRVEGGYGASMHTILKCLPNITHFFLSLDITATNNTVGLCDGLHLINPTCVILQDIDSHRENKMLLNLIATLGKCLSNWDNLQTVDVPCGLYIWNRHADYIFDALKKSASLHTLVIPKANYEHASWVALTLKGTGLRNIQIKNPIKDKQAADSYFFDHFDENPTVTALLRYTVEEKLPPPHSATERAIQPSVAPSLNPFFIPMGSASVTVQESIWKRVLYYAISILEQEADVPRRLPLLLVSRTFNKLALPYYYSFVQLETPSAIPKFLHILVKHPTVGLEVRAVAFNRFTSTLGEIEFGSIKLPSLQRLTLSGSVTDATKLLHSYGSTLTELTIEIDAVKNLDINIFVLCPNLTFLTVSFDRVWDIVLPDVTDFVLGNTKHYNLTKVKFDFSAQFWNRSKGNLKIWDKVFEVFEPAHFPNLREVQLDCFVWPRTERDITKSIWVPWAERFLEDGVNMKDKDGEKWRSRLESRRR
ncbi:hypothetical protein B0H12DRAFT_820134 [Mycena haematopus]|nr:hypothetical protein B0H12DRAFT_820134 [Mycena haematopus]